MSYALLTKKLELEKSKFITAKSLKGYSRQVHLSYYNVIRYLLTNRYLLRILRGVFYINSLEERKRGKLDINHLDAIKEALAIKGVKNWYFGLETALKLNAVTHEYFVIDYVLSDTVYRPKPFKILGHNVKFLKVKKELFAFGILSDDLRYSDPEKTVLDMAYIAKYNSRTDTEIKDKIMPYLPACKKKRLLDYLEHYPHSVKKVIRSFL